MTPGTLSSTTWFSYIRYCRERSRSPFRDYADRNLGSLSSAHGWSLLNYVKFQLNKVLADSSGFRKRWNTRQMLNMKTRFVFALAFVVLGITPTCFEIVDTRLLTGDAFDGRQMLKGLALQIVPRLHGHPGNMPPKPMDDILVSQRCVSVGVLQYKCGDGTLVGHMVPYCSRSVPQSVTDAIAAHSLHGMQCCVDQNPWGTCGCHGPLSPRLLVKNFKE